MLVLMGLPISCSCVNGIVQHFTYISLYFSLDLLSDLTKCPDLLKLIIFLYLRSSVLVTTALLIEAWNCFRKVVMGVLILSETVLYKYINYLRISM